MDLFVARRCFSYLSLSDDAGNIGTSVRGILLGELVSPLHRKVRVAVPVGPVGESRPARFADGRVGVESGHRHHDLPALRTPQHRAGQHVGGGRRRGLRNGNLGRGLSAET